VGCRLSPRCFRPPSCRFWLLGRAPHRSLLVLRLCRPCMGRRLRRRVPGKRKRGWRQCCEVSSSSPRSHISEEPPTCIFIHVVAPSHDRLILTYVSHLTSRSLPRQSVVSKPVYRRLCGVLVRLALLNSVAKYICLATRKSDKHAPRLRPRLQIRDPGNRAPDSRAQGRRMHQAV
jgi:hypothetical protein